MASLSVDQRRALEEAATATPTIRRVADAFAAAGYDLHLVGGPVRDALAYTVNTQILPAWVVTEFGEEALTAGGVVMEWDVTPPKDRNSEASSLVTTAAAVKTLTEALAPHGVGLDVPALCDRFAVPVTSLAPTADVLASVATNAEKPAQEAAWN